MADQNNPYDQLQIEWDKLRADRDRLDAALTKLTADRDADLRRAGVEIAALRVVRDAAVAAVASEVKNLRHGRAHQAIVNLKKALAACSAPPAACIHEWIYIDDVYANCRHCSAILAPAAAEAEGADEPCPDCLGTGRDGGSSAPCPTCLRTADAGAGGGWVAPSIDDAARAINDHAIVRTTAGTIRELQEKLRAAEAALADEKRMSGHLQEQWHASDVKLQVAEAERDAQKSLATSLHQAGSDLIASLERAQRQRADAVDRAAAVEAERDDWKRLCEAGRKAFLGELPQRLEATQRDVEYRTQERDEARARIASLTGLLERALPHVSEARGRSGSLPEHVQIEADIRGVLEHRPEGDGGKL
jgi:hypothetical protein